MESSETKEMFLKLVAGLTIMVGSHLNVEALPVPIEERVNAVRKAETIKTGEIKNKLPEGQAPTNLVLPETFSGPELKFVQWLNWNNWGNWNNWANFTNWNNWGNFVNWRNY